MVCGAFFVDKSETKCSEASHVQCGGRKRRWRSEISGIKYTDNGGFWLNDVVTDANGNFRNVG